MSRLTGLPVAEILNNTIEIAVRLSKDYNLVTLLKDASTIIAAPDGDYYINTSGNSALSKAGSGDVLCGLIAGFIAQKTSVFTAGVLGAYIHGKAGEAAALQKSLYGVTATDLIASVPLVINGLSAPQAGGSNA
jgi:NAD(P)H-hydrate epimerase